MVETVPSEVIATGEPAPPGRSVRAWAWALLGLVVLGGALAYAYTPAFAFFARWWEEPSYTHGWLVAPIAAGLLWTRRASFPSVGVRPSVWGFATLLGVLALRAYFYRAGEEWAEMATAIAAVAALTWALGGGSLVRWAWPGLVYLTFMMPLPTFINQALSGRLQSLATFGSKTILEVLSLPVFAEGNVIYVGEQTLEVEQACNGLSMLMTFVALVVAVVIVRSEEPIWNRLALLVSAVPIALISNIFRIVLTACAYHGLGPHALLLPRSLDPKGVWTVGWLSHDAAGWLMMPIGLGLVYLELTLLNWLLVPEDAPVAPKIEGRTSGFIIGGKGR